MPYIKQKQRDAVAEAAAVLGHEIEGQELGWTGRMAYAITYLLNYTRPKSYSDYATLVGVLETVKLEFYRRAVAAYEDEKKSENGDVF